MTLLRIDYGEAPGAAAPSRATRLRGWLRKQRGNAHDRVEKMARILLRWQSAIPDEGRIMLTGLVLLALGVGTMFSLSAAAIATGAILTATALGLSLRAPMTSGLFLAGGIALTILALLRDAVLR